MQIGQESSSEEENSPSRLEAMACSSTEAFNTSQLPRIKGTGVGSDGPEVMPGSGIEPVEKSTETSDPESTVEKAAQKPIWFRRKVLCAPLWLIITLFISAIVIGVYLGYFYGIHKQHSPSPTKPSMGLDQT